MLSLLLLAMVLATASTSAPDSAASLPGFQHMAFMIGDWDYAARMRQPDGSFQPGQFRTRARYIFNGAALAEDFGAMNEAGDFVVYGTTLRTYDERAGKFRMVWVSRDFNQVTRMEGDRVDGELHFRGSGSDAQGDYIERIRFYDITPDAYSWSMDRSYDGGTTWLEKFFSYHATRVK